MTLAPVTSTRRYKRLYSRDDLHGEKLFDFVQIFNRRLTKRMSTCHMQIISAQDPDHLRGGVRMNFKFRQSIMVRSELHLDSSKSADIFYTPFKFSNKSVLVLCATNQDNTRDVIGKLCKDFAIHPDHVDKLQLYERELSISLQDIFYRKLAPTEIPLELNLLWSVNQERKSLVLTDHDPNQTHYEALEMTQLEQKLANLNMEEEEAVESLKKNFSELRKKLLLLINSNE